MQYETNQRFLSISQRALLASLVFQGCNALKSVLRKCSASASHWVSFSHCDYVL
jgi:hypothetical protein